MQYHTWVVDTISRREFSEDVSLLLSGAVVPFPVVREKSAVKFRLPWTPNRGELKGGVRCLSAPMIHVTFTP